MERHLRSALIALVLFVLQTVFVPFMMLGGVVPDLLLIWVVYTALRRGQVEAMVAGFAVGLLQDVTTTQFFGLAALAKTLAGFTAGYFFNENRTAQTLGSYRFLLIVATASIVQNLIYFAIFFQGADVPVVPTTLHFTLATTFYTTAVGLLAMFAFSRKSLAA
jgi:rod shape-determining protein MreD